MPRTIEPAAITSHTSESLEQAVDSLMPQLTQELVELVRIPSISADGFPSEPMDAAFNLVIELLRDAGLRDVDRLDLPDTYPIVTAEIAAPPGAPTVLLYSHYD